MDGITILGIVIGILGLLASIAGTYLAWISFVDPMQRFEKYLKDPNGWEKFIGIEDHIYFYRYKKYPNFRIVIDWNKAIERDFSEEWMNNIPISDKKNNASYIVSMEVNSMLIDKELFVSLDGHRYFVPVPNRFIVNDGIMTFFYNQRQVQLANIVGKYFFEKDIFKFAKRTLIDISAKNN